MNKTQARTQGKRPYISAVSLEAAARQLKKIDEERDGISPTLQDIAEWLSGNYEEIANRWNGYDDLMEVLRDALASFELTFKERKDMAFVNKQIALLPSWVTKARQALNNASK